MRGSRDQCWNSCSVSLVSLWESRTPSVRNSLRVLGPQVHHTRACKFFSCPRKLRDPLSGIYPKRMFYRELVSSFLKIFKFKGEIDLLST